MEFKVTCPTCGGSGRTSGGRKECWQCRGKGEVEH